MQTFSPGVGTRRPQGHKQGQQMLDGGMILQALLGMAGLRTAAIWALRVSILTGVLAALLW